MTSIVEFLTARLDEDEAVARSVLEFYQDDPNQTRGYTHTDLDPDSDGFNAFDPAPAAYLRWFTPQREMAEIAAKRDVLREVQGMIIQIDGEWGSGMMSDASWGQEDALQAMALVYQDHEDYQAEWRPEPLRVWPPSKPQPLGPNWG